MNNEELRKIVEGLIDSTNIAGSKSVELQKKGLKITIKPDKSPVSNGDLEVNRIITNKIRKLTPNILVVSEETSENKSNNNLENFWLVDPIDGTHDYINNLEEFTINAGLILDNQPAAGLIYAPAKKRMFYSYGEDMSFEFTNGKTTKLEGSKKFICLEYEI